jgi:hypothetical protein
MPFTRSGVFSGTSAIVRLNIAPSYAGLMKTETKSGWAHEAHVVAARLRRPFVPRVDEVLQSAELHIRRLRDVGRQPQPRYGIRRR